MATGGTVAQDLTMQWSVLNDFIQDLSLMIIDEGQQYGTDREIATISLLKQQPLILWIRHGLRSNRTYFMPSNLAEAMVKLLEDTANKAMKSVKHKRHCYYPVQRKVLAFFSKPVVFRRVYVLSLTLRSTTGSLSATQE